MIFGFLPSGMNCQANQMVRYWEINPGSWQRITIHDAQDYANKGYFVVRGWINLSGSSGHVVLIVPGTAVYHSKWKANLPNVMDTGENKRWDSEPINRSFGLPKKNQIQYYYFK